MELEYINNETIGPENLKKMAMKATPSPYMMKVKLFLS